MDATARTFALILAFAAGLPAGASGQQARPSGPIRLVAGEAPRGVSHAPPVAQTPAPSVWGWLRKRVGGDLAPEPPGPATSPEQPDWRGVPYHAPTPRRGSSTARPIVDPDRTAAATSPAAERRSAATPATPRIPVPPSMTRSTAPAATASSRRPEVQNNLETQTPAATVRADGGGPPAVSAVELPRVARRPLPPVRDAESSRRASREEATEPRAAGESSRRLPTGNASVAPLEVERPLAVEPNGPELETPWLAGTDGGEIDPADAPSGLSLPELPGEAIAGGGNGTDENLGRAVGSGLEMPSTAPGSALSLNPTGGESFRARTASSVLPTGKMNSEIPAVRVVTQAPQEIVVRQPMPYEIQVENRGAADAPGVLLRTTLPSWVAVNQRQASRGEVTIEGAGEERMLIWEVEGLPAGATETLSLELLADRAEAFDVAVDWAVMPQTNISRVQVRQPKLELLLEGPDEVVFGQSKTYRVRVLNPGTGDAQDVVFTLGADSPQPQTQRIGLLPAGKEAQFEIELTAQELEPLEIHGLVTGAPELSVQAVKRVKVTTARLELTLQGPASRHLNADAAYEVALVNEGTATSRNVQMTLELPAGTDFVGGIEEATVEGQTVRWIIPRLAAGEEVKFPFTARMTAAGAQRLAAQCQGSAGGRASVDLTTEVEAFADLRLTVNDPASPSSVGQEVTYEIVLRNRGSRPARQVRAIAQFSHGIEPLRTEGGDGEVVPGQVLFEPITEIAPQESVTLRVIARAEEAGSHRFRSEVTSGDIVLVAEETTRYVGGAAERISRRSGNKTH